MPELSRQGQNISFYNFSKFCRKCDIVVVFGWTSVMGHSTLVNTLFVIKDKGAVPAFSILCSSSPVVVPACSIIAPRLSSILPSLLQSPISPPFCSIRPSLLYFQPPFSIISPILFESPFLPPILQYPSHPCPISILTAMLQYQSEPSPFLTPVLQYPSKQSPFSSSFSGLCLIFLHSRPSSPVSGHAFSIISTPVLQ